MNESFPNIQDPSDMNMQLIFLQRNSVYLVFFIARATMKKI